MLRDAIANRFETRLVNGATITTVLGTEKTIIAENGQFYRLHGAVSRYALVSVRRSRVAVASCVDGRTLCVSIGVHITDRWSHNNSNNKNNA
jgi:hypothetical protein